MTARAMTKTDREWGMRVAARLLDKTLDLRNAGAEILGFNLTRIDLVRMILSVGGFSIDCPVKGERDLYNAQSKATACFLEQMLKDKYFNLSVVNYLWDNVGHQLNNDWKQALCTHLTAEGLYALLMIEPSDAFKNTGMLPLPGKIVPHIPVEKRGAILDKAVKSKKLAELYAMTGWEECRDNAKGADRDSLIACDLGL